MYSLRFQPGHLRTILVPAAREAQNDHVRLRPDRSDLHRLDDCVGRFQGGDDPLQPAADTEAFQGPGVVYARVPDAALVLPVAVLRADAGIVEPGRDRMYRGRLP